MQQYSMEPLLEEEAKPKPNWKRRILIGAACLLGLLVVGWWIISSEMFLRGVVIKKIGKAINAEISFKSADWSPRRSVVLRDVRLKAVGQEPCLEAREITVNFRLGDLLAGKVDLGDMKIVEPIISIRMDAEGKTNLDPFFEQREKPDKPAQVEIGQFVLQQGALNFHRQFHSGSDERVTVRHLDIRGENIGNKRAGKLIISAGLQYVLQRAGVEVADKLEGTLTLECDQELDLKWLPKSISVHTKVLVEESSGQFAFANGLVANLETRMTPTELRHFQLDFQHEGNFIGNLLLSGPVDLLNGSANLHVAVNGIDGQVLNFMGRSQGLDFHETVLSSTNRLVLSGFGKQIKLHGAVRATPVRISLDRVSLPSVDALEMQYDFTVDLAGKRASFDALSLNATHKAKHFLTGKINQPMTLAWGGDVIEAPDSEFEMKLMNTDVADWQPWLGRFAKSGSMAASVKIGVKNNGRGIRFDSLGSITSLQIPLNENEIKVGNFNLNAKGKITNFRKLEFTRFVAKAEQPGKNIFRYEGEPVVDIAAQTIGGAGKLEADLPVFLSWFPQKGVTCKAGRMEYAGSFSANLRSPQSQSIEGNLTVQNVQATIHKSNVTNFTGTAEVKLRLDEGHRLHIGSINANGFLNDKHLVAQVYATGDWNLRDGSAKLNVVAVKDLDLSLLKTVVPLKDILNGRVDANLKTVDHNPGKKTTAEVSVNIRGGAVKGWPSDVNLDGSGDVEITWLDRGQFIFQASDMHVTSLNKQNPKQHDAMLKGAVTLDGRTGVFEVTLKSSEWDLPFLHPLVAAHLGGIELLDAKISHAMPVILRGDGQGVIEIKGPLQIERVRLKDSQGLLPKGRLAADANLDLKFNRNGNGWQIEAKKTSARFSLDDRNAGQIRLSGVVHSSPLAGNFDLSVENVDHHIVSLLSGSLADQVRMVAGRIVSLETSGAFIGKKVTGSLNVELKEADIRMKNGCWPPGAMDVSYKLEDAEFSLGGDPFIFKAETNKLNVKQNDIEVASFDMKISVKDSDYSFRIKSMDLKPPFTSLGLEAWLPHQVVQAGRLRVNESELRLDPRGNGHFKGNIQFSGFTLPSDQINEKPTPLDASFVIDAGVTNNVFGIKRFTANLPRTGKAENVGTISGQIDLTNLRAPTGRIQLKSDALDITPLVAFLKSTKAPAKGQAAAKPASPSTRPPVDSPQVMPDQQQVSANHFSFRQFAVRLDVKQIHWRDLNATAVRGEVQFDCPVVKLEPVEMLLQGAPVMVDGWILPSGNATKFNLQLSCERLPLTPIARHFDPALNPKFDFGELTLHSHVRVDALSGETFSRTLSIRGIDGESANLMLRSAILGRIKKAPANGQPDPTLLSPVFDVLGAIGIPLGPVDQLAGGLSESLSGTFKIKELDGAHFSEFELDLLIENTIGHNRLSAQGPLIGFKTEGDFRLAPNWGDTRLQQPLEVSLVGRLEKKLRITGGILIDNDKHYPLNITASLEGTLAKPKPNLTDLSKFGLGTLRILGKPAEFIESLPNLPFLPKEINPFRLLDNLINGDDER